MQNFLLRIIKPTGAYARWLIFLTLVAIVAAAATGQLEIVRAYLDTEALTFRSGNFEMTAYGALRAALILILVFWVTAAISDGVEKRVANFKRMRAATRVIVAKTFQITIYIVAFLIALDIVGLDLTTLTIFGGALGIGIGFGLQKIASNFVSGLILLFERAVEQDDLIELPDGTAGFLRRTSARYALLETFDGKEILIPNEDLITMRVTNWTLTNSKGRIEIPVGVAYGSDLELAHKLMLEAATSHPSCIDDPAPVCFLQNFGDSAIEFSLLFWVADVTEGRREPQSDVMFAISRAFKENGIEIPFPQRDVHIKGRESG